MQHLDGGDWWIIGLYLVGIIILGFRLGKGQSSTRDYFLGGRNLPWWGVSFSIVATETSALTFIGVPALAFGGDLAFIQIIIGYVIARVILAIVLVPHYFRGEIYSPYQLVENAFGPSARQTASLLFLVAGTLAAGVRVYVTCIPLDLIMGDFLEAWFGNAIVGAIFLFVGLSLVYTFVGGIKAVVWTDALQFLLLLGGGLFACFYLPTLIEGGWKGAMTAAGEAGKLHWFNSRFSLSFPYNIWMGLVGATIMVMSTHGADQLIAQRVLACRSVQDGRRALILSALIILPLFLLFLVVGVLLFVFYQQVAPAIPLPESQAGFRQNDYVFPVFIITATPPLIKGLLIVAILSAAMSSVSSALSALASVSTMDLFKTWSRKRRSEAFYFRLSRYSTIFWGMMLVLVALASRGVEFVLNWAFALNGLTNGALLGGLILALFFRQRHGHTVVAAMLVSVGAMVGLSQLTWTVEVDGQEIVQKIAWPWYTLIGTSVTLAVSAMLGGLAGRHSTREFPQKTEP